MGIGIVFSGIGNGVIKLIKFGWFFARKYGFAMTFSLIILALVLIISTTQAIEEKSPLPIIREVGGRLVNADQVIFDKVLTATVISEEALPPDRLLMFFLILPEIFFIMFNWKLFAKFVKILLGEGTPPLQRKFITFLLIWFFQIIYLLIFGNLPAVLLGAGSATEKLIILLPFKGLWLLVLNIGFFFSIAPSLLENISELRKSIPTLQ